MQCRVNYAVVMATILLEQRGLSRIVRSGFTVVELLTTIAIVGVLASLLLPAVSAAREAARRTTCISRLRQNALAVRQYESTQRLLPPGRIGCDDSGDDGQVGPCPPGLPVEKKTAASGFISILPQLELQSLFDQLSVAEGGLWNRNVDDLEWYKEPLKCRAIKIRVTMFICPSDGSAAISDVYAPVDAATSSYAFVQGSLGPGSPPNEVKFGNNGLFLYVTQRSENDIRDGLSNTAMIGEVVAAQTWESSNTWSYALIHADCLRTTRNPLNTLPGAGETVERQNGAFGSQHPGGAVFCFADGRTSFVNDALDMRAYRAMSTIEGGER